MPLAALVFLVTVAYLPEALSAAVAPRWWLIMVGAPLLLLMVPKVRFTATHWLGLLFLLICLGSAAYSEALIDSTVALVEYVSLALIFCVAGEQKDLTPVWLGLGAGVALNTVVGLISWFNPGHIDSLGFAGLFYHQDFFGCVAALALVGMIYGVKHKTNMVKLLCVIVTLGLILSASRGAALAAMAGLATPLLLKGSPPKRVSLALSLVTMVIALSVLFFAIEAGRRAAMTFRLTEWDWVRQNLRWFGWGIGSLGSLFPFEHADNDYVEMAFELGLLSISFWVFIASALRGAQYAQGSFAVLIVLLVDGLSSDPFHNPASACIAAIVVGHLACAYDRSLDPGRWRTILRRSRAQEYGRDWSASDLQQIIGPLPARPSN